MNKFLLTLSIFFFSFYICENSHALNYFSFKTNKYLTSKDQELEVQFNYKFEGYEENEFIVRPVLSNGLAKVFNQENGTWISQADLWTNMPQLQENMKIKLDFNGSSDLYFQIQNTTNAQICETPKQTIWSESSSSDYINALNKNIKMYALRKESSDRKSKTTGSADSNQQKSEGLFARVIKYIGEII